MKFVVMITGIVFALIAIFSYQLGIDNDAGWGRGRLMLLYTGIAVSLLGLSMHLVGKQIASFFHTISNTLENRINRSVRITVVTLLACMTIIPTYAWFIQFDERDAGSGYQYYIELAKSLRQGKLNLSDEPPAELLALENPYNYSLRKEKEVENFPWDVSLYDGKFYIYWGPAPSVIVAAIFAEDALEGLGDFHLVFVFASGAFIYMALLLSNYWRYSLKKAPVWLFGFLLITIGMTTPVTIMLKDARVYEAAIFGGQFFFIGGVFWAYIASQKDKPVYWMWVLASLHWGFAVGTRVLILPAVAFCVLLTLAHHLKRSSKDTLTAITSRSLPLFVPLGVIGLGIAWYNWARFDSIFEFGLTYQLANTDYTNFVGVFSPSRILENIELYFFHPLKSLPRFPYIMRIEHINSNDRLGGLVYIAPILYLYFIPIVDFLRNAIQRPQQELASSQNRSDSWLLQALFGAGSILLALLLTYYFVAMRFIEDFMPVFLLLLSIQIGKSFEFNMRNKFYLNSILVLIIALGIMTITVNTVLAIPKSGSDFMINFLNSVSKLIGIR